MEILSATRDMSRRVGALESHQQTSGHSGRLIKPTISRMDVLKMINSGSSEIDIINSYIKRGVDTDVAVNIVSQLFLEHASLIKFHSSIQENEDV